MMLVSVTTAFFRCSSLAEGRRIRPQNGESSLLFSRSHNC